MSLPAEEAAASVESAAPHPARPRAPMSLVVLAVLAVGYTLWAAQDLILPVLLAMFFAMVGNPIIRLLQRIRQYALNKAHALDIADRLAHDALSI